MLFLDRFSLAFEGGLEILRTDLESATVEGARGLGVDGAGGVMLLARPLPEGLPKGFDLSVF